MAEKKDLMYIIGIDIKVDQVQISVFQEIYKEPIEVIKQYRDDLYEQIAQVFLEKEIRMEQVKEVIFTTDETTKKVRQGYIELAVRLGVPREKISIITQETAYLHYIYRQEEKIWDHRVLLFDYGRDKIICRKMEIMQRSIPMQIQLNEMDVSVPALFTGTLDSRDDVFSKVIRKVIGKEAITSVFLTGSGFYGNWMKKSLKVLCSGRRVFLGENLYSNGACFFGAYKDKKREPGEEPIVKARDLVIHDIGVLSGDGDAEQFIAITECGKEWYNTRGKLEVILDHGNRIEFLFRNRFADEVQKEILEISSLPARPDKTTRLEIEIKFQGANQGQILVRDLGFGSIYPATNKVFMKQFTLLS